jgi:hypothetical protein
MSLGSFFGDLFGGKSGVNAANQAAAAQQAANAQARGDITSSYGAAQGRISPYAQQGQQASTMYNDAIGVNGAGGYQKAFSNFNADPFRQGENDYTNLLTRNMFRRYNGQGMGNSGASGAAVARVGAERYGQQVADYRNRLMGAGQQGWQAAQAQAGLDTGQGQALSGNSMNVGNIEANRLTQGYQAKQAGLNNIMSAVGGAGNLLMSGFAPGAGGGYAFGNMRNMLMGTPRGNSGYGASWQPIVTQG